MINRSIRISLPPTPSPLTLNVGGTQLLQVVVLINVACELVPQTFLAVAVPYRPRPRPHPSRSFPLPPDPPRRKRAFLSAKSQLSFRLRHFFARSMKEGRGDALEHAFQVALIKNACFF